MINIIDEFQFNGTPGGGPPKVKEPKKPKKKK